MLEDFLDFLPEHSSSDDDDEDEKKFFFLDENFLIMLKLWQSF